MDGSRVFRDLSNGQSSTYLVRAICLATCKTKQATPFLRLTDDGPLLDHWEFASELLAGLDAAIKADLEPDRLVKIQVLALMHLHNDGIDGVERSSKYLSQATSEAWSMSLHHCNIPGNPEQRQCDYLWWSLRNFDRLNKPIMGSAPFIIDDTDVGIERIAAKQDDYRSQLMGVALTLGDLMKTATTVHKASRKVAVDDCHEFPLLSGLTMDIPFDRFHRSHRIYFEIWYHVAAMLSCRYSAPGSALYNRRLASADRTLDIISAEGHENLPPLPLVPYAMSVSTTVIYRALRDNERDSDAAYKDLRRCCDALDALSQRWTTVKGVAKLAKRLWKLTNSGSLGVQPDDTGERIHRGSNPEPEVTAASYGQPPVIHPRGNGPHLHDPRFSIPTSTQVNEALDGENPSDGNRNFQRQFLEPCPGIDASCFSLDRAFDELLDCGIPDVFQDPAVWGFFHTAHAGGSFGGQ